MIERKEDQLTKQMAKSKFEKISKPKRWNLIKETVNLSSHLKVNCASK